MGIKVQVEGLTFPEIRDLEKPNIQESSSSFSSLRMDPVGVAHELETEWELVSPVLTALSKSNLGMIVFHFCKETETERPANR